MPLRGSGFGYGLVREWRVCGGVLGEEEKIPILHVLGSICVGV